MNYLKKRKSAISFAFSGLREAFKNESHIKLQIVIGLIVINAGYYFQISKIEWFILLICIFLVISLELVNSAIEKLCDMVSPDYDTKIKYIKDVSAAAVLVACFFSIIAGLMVFWPYIKLLTH